MPISLTTTANAHFIKGNRHLVDGNTHLINRNHTAIS
jgi:hypothetical protein